MSAIGILGGMGPQASARLYDLLIAGTRSYVADAVDDAYPEIVLLSVPVPNFISDKTHAREAKRMLIERTKLLETAGCSVNGIACNTVHILLPELQAATSVPFVSIPALVAEKVSAASFGRVGLLATPTTLASTLYDDALRGIADITRPNADFAQRTEGLIFAQLNGRLADNERDDFRQQVKDFMAENNLDAVILGCTELPLVFGDTAQDEHIIDTLQVLADGLLARYFAA